MKVELKSEYSTSNPDEVAALAARGDHFDGSLVGDGTAEAMDEIRAASDDPTSKNEAIYEFNKSLLRRGHFGPFEHPRAFFAVEGITRDMMAQITRHRVGVSFDVQSMRYVSFEDADMEIPESAEETVLNFDTENAKGDVIETSLPAETIYRDSYEAAQRSYNDLVEAGVDKEHARKVLPIGTKVNMTFSANLRALMHVFDLRVSGAAQDDTRGLAEHVKEETREWAPLTIDAYDEYVRGSSLNSP
jgi:thymidylate synthase (FAD)